MSTVLEGLGQATQMTDAARQLTEQAALVANKTATAVRETTQRAVVDARARRASDPRRNRRDAGSCCRNAATSLNRPLWLRARFGSEPPPPIVTLLRSRSA